MTANPSVVSNNVVQVSTWICDNSMSDCGFDLSEPEPHIQRWQRLPLPPELRRGGYLQPSRGWHTTSPR